MNKSFIITFCISVIVMFSICVITLMLMLPQTTVTIQGEVEKYEQVIKSNYTFEKTKNISKETLIREYNIDSQAIYNFESNKQYKPGNSDPFTPVETNTTGNNGNTGTSNEDKTTNSNGGTPNPPSTTK